MSRIVRQLAPGDELDIAEFTTWLASTGYNRAEAIEQPGDFTVRGGVIDVFPPGEAPAVRIDLFGDTIDTLAEIDLDSLGSNRKLDRVRLVGATVDKLQDDDASVPLWSLLDSQTVVVMHEPLEIAEQARGYFERLTNPVGIYSPQAVLKALQKQPGVAIAQFGGGGGGGQREIDLPVDRLHNFAEHANEAIVELGAFALGRDEHPPHDVTVLCQKQAELDRLHELILEHAPDAADRITLELGYLHRGFVWGAADGRCMFLPHHELFHRYASRRRLRRVSVGSLGKGSETFFDLEPGDYVVHADHGVAVFRGLRTMRKGDAAEEYLTLEFADKALLHVPASQIDLVQKYIGGFSGRPPLSKLGGKRWKKQKEQVAEAVKDLAAELLRVQAARAAMPGIAFPEDSPWMTQFEEEFPYDETEDQLAGIVAIKRDMTADRPMDRLICGDVGFGKTELAIRAAFKAVEAGRQVAVLCPTTVLCEQHERTFRQRMADYPVRVESLSRFKTAGEAKQIVEQLAEGKVDIAIGTHRVLSDDVHFKDLGLVVVDEEQRFGVEHKNKLMRFRTSRLMC
jgi:transcription-repair coupling factor (superfamily II helicase)